MQAFINSSLLRNTRATAMSHVLSKVRTSKWKKLSLVTVSWHFLGPHRCLQSHSVNMPKENFLGVFLLNKALWGQTNGGEIVLILPEFQFEALTFDRMLRWSWANLECCWAERDACYCFDLIRNARIVHWNRLTQYDRTFGMTAIS